MHMRTTPMAARRLRTTSMAMLAVGVLLAPSSADAQFDLTGKWASRSGQDAQERGPGPDPVDYMGLPLNDEGRARALSYDYSLMSLPEGQCGYHTPFYIVLGPFGLHIWNEFDPVTGRLLAWKIGGWVDRDVTTIWMDGRPHPSPNAPHTYAGFTTGRWEGDTLVTTTTHMKADHDPSQRRAGERPGHDDHVLRPARGAAHGPCRHG